uniref:Leucine-rich repeat protein n=1 Tax=Paramoeba aestuarina TaxID=180227 RepID=A0A7S4PAD4_9EUKA
MPLAFFTTLADPSCLLGRPDYSLLSDQSLMEILVQDAEFSLPNVFKDNDGAFLDIDSWETIKLDADGKVIFIEFVECFGCGKLNLEAIPRSVRKFEVGNTECSGDVPFSKLCNEVRFMTLHDTWFYGSVDLTRIPRKMIRFTLSRSKFSGTLDFSNLPPTLVALDLRWNAFTGSIDISYITANIREDSFQHFQLQFYDAEPVEGMDFGIDLSKNQFEGDIIVRDLSKITDEGQFRENKSEYMRDTKGERQLLEQLLAEDDFEF